MPFLEHLKIEMPADFPANEFAEFMDRARALLLNPKGNEWQELGGASNIMGWRFRNCTEALDEFAESWKKYGDGAGTHEELYKRDRALFAMFSSGVSCIEATCYGIYALVSHPKILAVPFTEKEQKHAYPGQLRDKINACQPGSALGKTLDEMLASAEWKTWMDFRNRMAHRSNLPRIIAMTVGSPLPDSPPLKVAGTSSTQPFSADLNGLRGLVAWLGETHRALLVAATAMILAPGTP